VPLSTVLLYEQLVVLYDSIAIYRGEFVGILAYYEVHGMRVTGEKGRQILASK
jgi:hypothetical protein